MTTTFAGSHDHKAPYAATTASHASGYYNDTGGVRHSLKSQIIAMSASTAKEGFAFVYPLNRYGQPAKVWANFTGSGHSLHLTVIESGSGFLVDSSNNLLGPEETNFVA